MGRYPISALADLLEGSEELARRPPIPRGTGHLRSGRPRPSVPARVFPVRSASPVPGGQRWGNRWGRGWSPFLWRCPHPGSLRVGVRAGGPPSAPPHPQAGGPQLVTHTPSISERLSRKKASAQPWPPALVLNGLCTREHLLLSPPSAPFL